VTSFLKVTGAGTIQLKTPTSAERQKQKKGGAS